MSLSAQGYEAFEAQDSSVLDWLNTQLLERLSSPQGTSSLNSSGYHLLASKVSMERLSEKLTRKFSHAARLYEQGRLHSLKALELYLTHWLRWAKGLALRH